MQPMSSSMPDARARDPNRWPRQVRYILGNEAAERFSYYGMRGILALYITNVLLQTKDYATEVIHLFGTVNYFTPLLAPWVADRLWGRYNTILWISFSYCAGHGVMALSDFIPTVDGKLICLWIGLGLIAFGAGGIKPCVSAFMGDQFRPEQRHLLQKAYAAFYWSINLGSTASFFLIRSSEKAMATAGRSACRELPWPSPPLSFGSAHATTSGFTCRG
jgi:POT family proton-dependent oligopeptide transporter